MPSPIALQKLMRDCESEIGSKVHRFKVLTRGACDNCTPICPTCDAGDPTSVVPFHEVCPNV